MKHAVLGSVQPEVFKALDNNVVDNPVIRVFLNNFHRTN